MSSTIQQLKEMEQAMGLTGFELVTFVKKQQIWEREEREKQRQERNQEERLVKQRQRELEKEEKERQFVGN